MAPSNHLTKIFQNFLPMHVRELLPRILSEDSLRIPAYVPYENSSGVSLEFFSRVFPDCLPCVLPAISKILSGASTGISSEESQMEYFRKCVACSCDISSTVVRESLPVILRKLRPNFLREPS